MALINGTAAADPLNGTIAADTIYGFEGNDTINSGTGKDTIYAGADNDKVDAGGDNDTLFGDAGNDTMTGNSGHDYLEGGTGSDVLNGDSGDDYILGDDSTQGGGDTVLGANLVVNGGFEDPNIPTGSFGIFAAGVTGWAISSGPALEIQDHYPGLIAAIEGSQHAELDSTGNSGISQDIATTAGQEYQIDLLYSPRDGVASASNPIEVRWEGTLIDTLTGGPASGWTPHTYNVVAIDANSTLEFRAVGTNDSLGGFIDAISVRQFDVTDIGGADSLNGGSGNDTVAGGGGNDSIYGDSGNDTLSGDDGDDIVTDNSGNDVLFGGEGNDRLIDNSGNDTLAGGLGDDTLTAGASTGKDVFHFALGDGNDHFTDYNDGLDKIRLDMAVGATFAADVATHISQVGVDTLIDFGVNGSITLDNVAMGVLTASDFIFV